MRGAGQRRLGTCLRACMAVFTCAVCRNAESSSTRRIKTQTHHAHAHREVRPQVAVLAKEVAVSQEYSSNRSEANEVAVAPRTVCVRECACAYVFSCMLVCVCVCKPSCLSSNRSL